MIFLNYQTYGSTGFHLRLRLYQGGETKFISVTKFLKGDIQKKHWNARKQTFISSCPFAEENNKILEKIMDRYRDAALNWTGTLNGLMISMERLRVEEEQTIEGYYALMVERAKKNSHSDGSLKSTFEEYLKVEKRIQEFCAFKKVEYRSLLLKEVTPYFVNNMLDWVETERKGRGLRYISKGLHSFISKADKDGFLNAEDFKRCKWFKDNPASSQKYNTLTAEQIEQFKTLDLYSVSKSPLNEFYRDICLFILHSGMSVCDVLSLRYSDKLNIGGACHFMFKRRKIAEKQKNECAVPISKEMEDIMEKWQWCSRDGYIFPIRNLHKLRVQGTNNGDIKHFIGNINYWLKKIGKALKLSFPLRTYTFRHTSITRYVSKNIPVAYISNMMGTSIKNIESVYYNNLGDVASRNKVLYAMSSL